MRCTSVGLMRVGMLCGAALALPPSRAAAQVAPAAPVVAPPPPGVKLTASARVRTEAWDWFTPNMSSADEGYAFTATVLRGGIGAKRSGYEWQVDLAVPILLGLPDNAVAPAPQGQLGLGGSYRAENGDRKVGLIAKQAFLRVKLGSGAAAPSLRAGRFEFNEGQEMQPGDATLAWLKRERIAQRLIGSFAFTHVGRSFDGLQFVHATPTTNVTVVGARPTKGVFQLDGLDQLDVNFAYAALTKPLFYRTSTERREARAEGRLFALYYDDGRDVLKVDNRPAAVRSADQAHIRIATFGAHYLHAFTAGPGKMDVLLWGAGQTGDWGGQTHRAGAVAAEIGYQPDVKTLKPWVRLGYFLGSGDADPADGSHGTFFGVLPTPRLFARVPFYNLMNVQDAFAQVILRPSPRWTLRGDVHALRLAESRDLWYAGGGAFDAVSFGVAGRPAGGARDLARLFDLSVDYQPSPAYGFTLYAGHVRGDDVVRSIHPAGSAATFAYLELRRQF